jgi:prepilin-type N-terminal cleavage/methylation domain-containing protein
MRRRGFTLVELMIVVAIIGVLATLAQSTFRAQTQRARRAEAVVGLQSIRRAQVIYHNTNAIYGDTFDEIGFALEGAVHNDEHTQTAKTYTFTMRALPLDGNERGNYQAIATGDLDKGDAVMDILMIENQLELVH